MKKNEEDDGESITTTMKKEDSNHLKNLLHFTKQDIRLYTHPNFDWKDKKSWQNDPKAVQYWIKNIKDKRYPDDFTEKTY